MTTETPMVAGAVARPVPRWVPAGLLAVFAAVIVKAGWVADEGLVVLRSALNTGHGWGAAVNPSAPLNEIDSPLWLLVGSVVGWATGEWVVTMFAVSAACSLAAVAVVLFRGRSLAAVGVGAAALLWSGAFVQFTTSGLAQPLSYLLVALVFVTAVRVAAAPTANGGGLLGGLAALTVLTSAGLVLLVAPLVAYVVVKSRRVEGLVFTTAGVLALPLALWAAWAATTLGSAVPDGAFTTWSWDGHLWESLRTDPVTFAVCAAGLLYVGVRGTGLHRSVAAGAVLYLLWAAGVAALPGELLAVPVYAVVLASVDAAPPRTAWKWQALLVAAAFAVPVTALTFAGLTPTAVAAWTGPQAADTSAWADATRGHRTFVAVFTGSGDPDIVEFTPFQPGELLASYDGPVTINSVRAAAQAWPDNTFTDAVIAQSVFAAQCDRRGVNGVLSGPSTEWTSTCR